jgi:subtilase family serine protease
MTNTTLLCLFFVVLAVCVVHATIFPLKLVINDVDSDPAVAWGRDFMQKSFKLPRRSAASGRAAGGIVTESARNLDKRSDLRKGSRATGRELHEVTLLLQHHNQDQLEQLLAALSTPTSPHYGQYKTMEELRTLIRNEESVVVVRQYLTEHCPHLRVVRESAGGDLLTVVGPVSALEELLSNAFHHYHYRYSTTTSPAGGEEEVTVLRAADYTLPRALSGHVSGVLHVVQFPQNKTPLPATTVAAAAQSTDAFVQFFQQQLPRSEPPVSAAATSKTTTESSVGGKMQGSTVSPASVAVGDQQAVTPDFLKSLYGVDLAAAIPGAANHTIVAIRNIDENSTYGLQDVAQFNADFQSLGGVISILDAEGECTTCRPDSDLTMSLEYATSIAPLSAVELFVVLPANNPWETLLQQLANLDSASSVFTLVMEEYEDVMSVSVMDMMNYYTIIYSLAGVSFVTSSGINGIAFECAGQNCSLRPTFPATLPYVTVVGSTTVRSRG